MSSTLGIAVLAVPRVVVRKTRARTGSRAPGWRAAAQALLFLFRVTTFVIGLVDVLIGLFRQDRRLGRDLVVNLVVVRAEI